MVLLIPGSWGKLTAPLLTLGLGKGTELCQGLCSRALASIHLLSSQGKEEEDKSFDMPPSWVAQIEITPDGLCPSPLPSPQGVLYP